MELIADDVGSRTEEQVKNYYNSLRKKAKSKIDFEGAELFDDLP